MGTQQWSPQSLRTYVEQGLVRQVIISEDEDWGRWASLKASASQDLELWVEVRSLSSAIRADQDQRVKGLVICTEEVKWAFVVTYLCICGYKTFINKAFKVHYGFMEA